MRKEEKEDKREETAQQTFERLPDEDMKQVTGGVSPSVTLDEARAVDKMAKRLQEKAEAAFR